MNRRVRSRFLIAIAMLYIFLQIPSLMVEAKQSEGKADFTENQSIVPPKDPENPARELNQVPTGNKTTAEKGPLSLDVVPTHFNFGKQQLDLEQHDYAAQAGKKQNVQVTDNRSQEKTGWRLKVRQNTELTDIKTGNKLAGAKLILPAAQLKNANLKQPAMLTEKVVITSEEQTIFHSMSQNGVGKGTSIGSWQSEDVTLSVPKNTAKIGSYQNKIYWILTDQGPLN